MKIAMLSPLSWRTPPRHYGPWENVVSLLTEQLVTMGVDVTLFASGDSHTRGKLAWVCERPWSEDSSINPDEAYFQEQVKPHIDGSAVEYLGSVGPEKRHEVLGGALALLHLIHFDEPFGLSVVESMVCGTPVIAFGRGSMPENQGAYRQSGRAAKSTKAPAPRRALDRGEWRGSGYSGRE
jgi:hypothetical protein